MLDLTKIADLVGKSCKILFNLTLSPSLMLHGMVRVYDGCVQYLCFDRALVS